MSGNAINPNHPVTKALDGNWMKIVALLLHKHGLSGTVLTLEDFDNLTKAFPGQMPVVCAFAKGDLIELTLKPESEARQFAATHGGWSQ